MTFEVGDPEFLSYSDGSATFTVGASEKSSSGKLIATGKITVIVPDSASYDDVSLREKAKELAFAMIAADPGLLTPESVNTGVPQHGTLKTLPDDKTPWSGTESKHETEKGADKPSGILSPDASGVNL